MKTEIINIKKLKKDGTIERSASRKIADYLRNDKIVLMPVDCIYGLVTVMGGHSLSHIPKLSHEKEEHIVRIVSSFKMLDDIARITKLEFDFLHRIWPGELIVYVKDIKSRNVSIPVRMPRSRYQQDIIDQVGSTLAYATLYSADRSVLYLKKDIIDALEDRIDCMLIIEEFCKEHTMPSVVDISKDTLTIINEGRVSAEEIKSLYFLGKDDAVI